MYFYEERVSLIDGASITIILCLHVLIGLGTGISKEMMG
jgi:hypothetical protein